MFALYNVVLWGHPKDAVAVACLLYACLAASEKRWSRFGWLIGAAVAFEPVVLLALPSCSLSPGGERWPGRWPAGGTDSVIARPTADDELVE